MSAQKTLVDEFPKGKQRRMPSRAFRAPDQLWEAALTVAEIQGVSLASELRRMLAVWVKVNMQIGQKAPHVDRAASRGADAPSQTFDSFAATVDTSRGVTASTVAARLGVSTSTLATWRKMRLGPPCFEIERCLLYPVAGLERWIRDRDKDTRVEA